MKPAEGSPAGGKPAEGPKPPRVVSARDEKFWVMVQAWRAAPVRSKKQRKAKEKLFREMLTKQNKLVTYYAYKFRSARVPMSDEDAYQAACLGFLQALNRWDPTKGAWITCYYIWCRKEVQAAQGLEPVVYRPVMAGKPYKIARKEEAFYAATGRNADAEDLGVTEKDVRKYEEVEIFQRYDLDAPHGQRSDGEDAIDKKIVPAPSKFAPEFVPDPEQALEDRRITVLLSELTEGEKGVLLGPDSDEKDEIRSRFLGYEV